jgi:hypothetical protein
LTRQPPGCARGGLRPVSVEGSREPGGARA